MRNIDRQFIEHTKQCAIENAFAPDLFTVARMVRTGIVEAERNGLDPLPFELAVRVFMAFKDANENWEKMAAQWVRSTFNAFGYARYTEVVARMIEEVRVEEGHTGLPERVFSNAVKEVIYGKLH